MKLIKLIFLSLLIFSCTESESEQQSVNETEALNQLMMAHDRLESEELALEDMNDESERENFLNFLSARTDRHFLRKILRDLTIVSRYTEILLDKAEKENKYDNTLEYERDFRRANELISVINNRLIELESYDNDNIIVLKGGPGLYDIPLHFTPILEGRVNEYKNFKLDKTGLVLDKDIPLLKESIVHQIHSLDEIITEKRLSFNEIQVEERKRNLLKNFLNKDLNDEQAKWTLVLNANSGDYHKLHQKVLSNLLVDADVHEMSLSMRLLDGRSKKLLKLVDKVLIDRNLSETLHLEAKRIKNEVSESNEFISKKLEENGHNSIVL